MIKDRYLKQIKQIINDNVQDNCKCFIYGSSIKKAFFGDIDIGLIEGSLDQAHIYKLIEIFENSTLPYKVDIIDFNGVAEKFKNKVFEEDVLWLT